MIKRGFTLLIIDEQTNDDVFESHFNYEDGKIKFLPSLNEISKTIKEFTENESEFDV